MDESFCSDLLSVERRNFDLPTSLVLFGLRFNCPDNRFLSEATVTAGEAACGFAASHSSTLFLVRIRPPHPLVIRRTQEERMFHSSSCRLLSNKMKVLSLLLHLISVSTSRAVPFILDSRGGPDPDLNLPPINTTPPRQSSSNESPLTTSNTKYISQEPDLTDFGSGIFPLSSASQHSRAYPLPAQNASDPNQEYSTTAGGTSTKDQLGSESGLLSWTVKNTNGSIEIPALAPSLVHLDLLKAGVIPDMNVGLNEGTSRWIFEEPTWTYTASIEPIMEKLKEKSYAEYLLYFQGLDVLADIYLGDAKVSSTDNQFRYWIFNVTDAMSTLQDQENKNLTLVFKNAVE